MTGRRGSRSHRHTKFNRYTGDVSRNRARGGLSLWWLVPASAIAAVIFALILGNCLGRKVEEPLETPEPEISEGETDSLFPPPFSSDAEVIDGVFVFLSTSYENTYAKVAEQIPEGTKAVSMSLFHDVVPQYYSKAAEDNGWIMGDLTLKNIFKYPNENGVYVSIPFPSRCLGKKSYFPINISLDVPMIQELYDAGADDVIIKRFDGSVDDEFILDLANYILEVKTAMPDLSVGFIITVEEARNTALVDRICDYADFCAVDMTEMKDADELKSAAQEVLVNILRYKMRVLIAGNEETLPPIYQVLDSLGINNRQVTGRK